AGLAGLSLADNDQVLILSGDTPLLTRAELLPLSTALESDVALSFMYFCAPDPTGYGRVIRDTNGMPVQIVEQRDLRTEAERAITEVNAGVYLARAGALKAALLRLTNDNAQGEYYLTDIVALIAEQARTSAVEAHPDVLAGVNDRAQLNQVERILHHRVRHRWCEQGVTMVGEPCIDDTVTLEPDVHLEQGVRLRGRTHVGAGTTIDVGSVIVDARIGKNASIKPYCVITDSQIGDQVALGPFAHLRPGSVLLEQAHVGNFVETKNARIGKGAKANHLAYVGDAEVGDGANLGAGTIVCNYDGFAKRKTVIGPGAFIGSDSQLIAPVTVGAGAYVATGTTVTQDVPEGAVAIGRARQSNKLGYAEPLRDRLREQARLEKAELDKTQQDKTQQDKAQPEKT
ncbi:MAG TPA: bifunctional UDP-N-acetylglucosamine diphosphorylase/glucosamine-1-phosphate N-acetyltransferase GlmU, partial [Polyangiaceae bacterium]|nr:bifunctional UDP-N-acetylglucosamine diphosphorylase/glucosamine-1-phosphate N-acetyltransferase GlmU [Polyangiaceae bacterium]